MKAKNIGLVILSIVIIAVLAFAGLWVGKNKDKISSLFNGTSIYTYEDIEKAYNDGYAVATKDIEQYKTSIKNLQQSLTAKETQLKNLQDRLDAMENCSEENALLKTQIKSLQQQIELYEESIHNYEQLLNGYHQEGKFIVNFLVNNESYYFTIAENGAILTIPNPVMQNNQTFLGWTVNGTDLVDLTTYQITKDTVFNAVIDNVITIKFMVDGQQYSVKEIQINSVVEVPTAPHKDKLKFLGWSLDGETTVDLSNYVFKSDSTLSAMFANGFTINESEVLAISNSTLNFEIKVDMKRNVEEYDITVFNLVSGNNTINLLPYTGALKMGCPLGNGQDYLKYYFNLSEFSNLSDIIIENVFPFRVAGESRFNYTVNSTMLLSDGTTQAITINILEIC